MQKQEQQTAVEWFAMKLSEKLGMPNAISFYVDNEKEILQAKEMEKEQIIEAYQQGVTDEHGDTITFTTEGKDYYNETYGGNK